MAPEFHASLCSRFGCHCHRRFFAGERRQFGTFSEHVVCSGQVESFLCSRWLLVERQRSRKSCVQVQAGCQRRRSRSKPRTDRMRSPILLPWALLRSAASQEDGNLQRISSIKSTFTASYFSRGLGHGMSFMALRLLTHSHNSRAAACALRSRGTGNFGSGSVRPRQMAWGVVLPSACRRDPLVFQVHDDPLPGRTDHTLL